MVSEFIFKYKEKAYTSKQLEHIIDFFNNVEDKLEETDLTICCLCDEVISKDELCTEHCCVKICKNCCPSCQGEKSYNDYVNSLIDESRGK